MERKTGDFNDLFLGACELSCIKEKCPKWVKMYQHVKQDDGTIKTVEDGRCYASWIPFLMVEQTSRIVEAINKLTEEQNGDKTV